MADSENFKKIDNLDKHKIDEGLYYISEYIDNKESSRLVDYICEESGWTSMKNLERRVLVVGGEVEKEGLI